jgi:serine phosphatase RsbU (regulator of sigma subunit)
VLRSFDLLPGESLLLYTDGLSEARSRKGEFF